MRRRRRSVPRQAAAPGLAVQERRRIVPPVDGMGAGPEGPPPRHPTRARKEDEGEELEIQFSRAALIATQPMVPESTTRGKSCAPAGSIFPDASVPLRYDQSADWTKARALSLGASGNSHAG